MFTPYGPELDAELAYRRESVRQSVHHEPHPSRSWIAALVHAAGLTR